MNRQGRLAHARSTNWLAKNKGAKNLVRRYRRYFGLDLVGAALELRALGVGISEERMTQLKATAESQSKSAKRKRKMAKLEEQDAMQRELDRCWPIWSDEPFPFAVDEWEVTTASHSEPIKKLAAPPKPGGGVPHPSEDDDFDIPF